MSRASDQVKKPQSLLAGPSRAHAATFTTGRIVTIALTLAIGLGAALRVWAVDFGLPHLEARPDESLLLEKALGVLGGDPNPHFFNYPSLFIYVLAGLFGLLYLGSRSAGIVDSFTHFEALVATDPVPLYLMARLFVALCGTLTIPAVFVLTRRLSNPAVGLLAALFLGVNFLHVRESHFAVTDVPLTLLVVVAVMYAMRAARASGTISFLLAGALAGFATSAKYNAVIWA